MNNIKPIDRTDFSLERKLIFQQDLATELESYVLSKHPEFVGEFEKSFPKSSESNESLGERLAIRFCLPVTMHRYLQAAGLLVDVSPLEYIDKVWAAFETTTNRHWSRPKLSRLTRKEYGIEVISAGIKWLNEPVTSDSRKRMIESGYCDNNEQIEKYIKYLHGKTVEEIVTVRPAVITLQSPVGAGLAHSVIGWDIKDGNLIYSNVDERDGGRIALTKAPLTCLATDVAKNGAVTILV